MPRKTPTFQTPTKTAPNRAALYSSKTDDWPTPVNFYNRLDAQFGFVLDVCSSTKNHKAPTYYALDHADPARRDGLARDWAADAAAAAAEGAGAIWMNPPYGRGIELWMAKAQQATQAGATVVCLVPVRSSSAWWHDLVLESGAEVLYVRGRLKFGTATTAAPFASAVVIYRPTDVLGTAGPVGTIAAVAPKTRSTTKPASEVIANYTPRGLHTPHWNLAAAQVRSAVTACEPTPADASALLSTLTRFLASPVWAGTTALDLPGLLTDARIDAFVATLPATRTRSVYRSNLRRIGKAVQTAQAAADGAEPPRGKCRGGRRYADPLLVEGGAFRIPASDLLHSWMHLRQRSMKTNPIEPLIAVWEQAATPNVRATHVGTVSPSASIRALAEVKDLTEKATVTSNPTAATSARHQGPGSGKPMTKRAIMEHAKKARAAAAAAANPTVRDIDLAELAAAVAPEAKQAIDSYTPRGPAAQLWADNHELALRLAYGHRPPSANNAKTTCTYIAGFLSWYSQSTHRAALGYSGGTIAAEELLDVRLVDHYLGQTTALTERSIGTIRSALRRALGSLNPEAQPRKVQHYPAMAPYSAEECRRFVGVAIHQPTDIGTANLCFIVGLGLGAGADATDIKGLTRAHFTDAHLPDGPVLLVTLGEGTKARTVPVRRTYEAMVRRALELHRSSGRADDAPLIGLSKKGRAPKNTVAAAVDRAKLASGEPLDLDLRRLRATWLVAAMSSPVPLRDLLAAAGLASSRTLAELLPHCPAPTADRVNEVLADMGDIISGPTPEYAQRERVAR